MHIDSTKSSERSGAFSRVRQRQRATIETGYAAFLPPVWNVWIRLSMRILVSDYSGHPFQVQLSRELARRGHKVTHSYSARFQTPKGNLNVSEGDPEGFDIVSVSNSKPFAKSSFFARRQQEVEIGHELARLVARIEPQVVISSNAPLDTQRIFQKAAARHGAKFVFWLQDIYSEAISRVVPQKFPGLGHLIAAWYRHLEFRMLRDSDYVVPITADFVPIISRKGVDPTKVTVVDNWAPLEEMPLYPADNDWAREHMPGDDLRIVYSGTLGYKHNPDLLLDLAQGVRGAAVHVYSEGAVAEKLAADAAAAGVTNLTLHPWVPFEDLPKMLSGADMFVVVIEPEAGIYSVPSKVLSYLTIGRPILASMPLSNAAARLIDDNRAGFVRPPGREDELVREANALASDLARRIELGDNGRRFAKMNFDIEAIGDRFEGIIRAIT
jgi:colanic acid biosynthesis glycosyl transferase WcaI